MIRNTNVNNKFLRISVWIAWKNLINNCRTTTTYAIGFKIGCFKLKKLQDFWYFRTSYWIIFYTEVKYFSKTLII